MVFLPFSPLCQVNVGDQLKKSPTQDTRFSINMLGTFNIDLVGGKGGGGGGGEKFILFKKV